MIPIARGGDGTAHLPASRSLAIDIDWRAGSKDQMHTVWRQLQQQPKQCKKKQTISVICTLPLWLHLCTQRQRLGPVGSTDHRRAHRSARATASTSHPLALDGLPKNNDNGVDVSLGSCARIFSTAHSCNNKRDPLWQPWRSATGRTSVCERVTARGWRVCNS